MTRACSAASVFVCYAVVAISTLAVSSWAHGYECRPEDFLCKTREAIDAAKLGQPHNLCPEGAIDSASAPPLNSCQQSYQKLFGPRDLCQHNGQNQNQEPKNEVHFSCGFGYIDTVFQTCASGTAPKWNSVTRQWEESTCNVDEIEKQEIEKTPRSGKPTISSKLSEFPVDRYIVAGLIDRLTNENCEEGAGACGFKELTGLSGDTSKSKCFDDGEDSFSIKTSDFRVDQERYNKPIPHLCGGLGETPASGGDFKIQYAQLPFIHCLTREIVGPDGTPKQVYMAVAENSAPYSSDALLTGNTDEGDCQRFRTFAWDQFQKRSLSHSRVACYAGHDRGGGGVADRPPIRLPEPVYNGQGQPIHETDLASYRSLMSRYRKSGLAGFSPDEVKRIHQALLFSDSLQEVVKKTPDCAPQIFIYSACNAEQNNCREFRKESPNTHTICPQAMINVEETASITWTSLDSILQMRCSPNFEKSLAASVPKTDPAGRDKPDRGGQPIVRASCSAEGNCP